MCIRDRGGAQVQPAQYRYPAGAQAQGAAGTGGAPNPDAPGRQSNDTLRGKQMLGMCAGIAGGAWAALMGVAALGGVSEVVWCISNGFSFGDELMLVVIPALLAAGGWNPTEKSNIHHIGGTYERPVQRKWPQKPGGRPGDVYKRQGRSVKICARRAFLR